MTASATGSPADPLDPKLRASVLAAHRRQAGRLLAQALGAWRDEGYTRFNDHETSCTVRVLNAMLVLLRAQAEHDLVQIFPQLEVVEPTPAQLAGEGDVSRAKRADLVLYLGGNHSHRICVECKRLFGSANGRQYAAEGVLRFVRGDYRGDRGTAFMVGYVMSRAIGERVSEINQAISEHRDLGASHCLEDAAPIPPIDDVLRSSHTGQIDSLVHFFVDMRSRVAPNSSRSSSTDA